MSDASLYVKQDSHHKLRVKAFQNNTFYANQILDIFRNSLYKEYEDLAEKLHIQIKNYEMFPLIYLHKHYIHNNLLLPKEHKRQIKKDEGNEYILNSRPKGTENTKSDPINK